MVTFNLAYLLFYVNGKIPKIFENDKIVTLKKIFTKIGKDFSISCFLYFAITIVYFRFDYYLLTLVFFSFL